MRPTSLVFAAVGGLVVGVAATWFVTHRASDMTRPMASSTTASTDKKALYWYDPMVPEQHFDKPGKSPFMDMQLVPKYAGGEPGGDGAGVIQIHAKCRTWGFARRRLRGARWHRRFVRPELSPLTSAPSPSCKLASLALSSVSTCVRRSLR
jgi:hypothetical protein